MHCPPVPEAATEDISGVAESGDGAGLNNHALTLQSSILCLASLGERGSHSCSKQVQVADYKGYWCEIPLHRLHGPPWPMGGIIHDAWCATLLQEPTHIKQVHLQHWLATRAGRNTALCLNANVAGKFEAYPVQMQDGHPDQRRSS